MKTNRNIIQNAKKIKSIVSEIFLFLLATLESTFLDIILCKES
jgi:hypothetical protein